MKITIVLGAFLPVPPVMGGAIEKSWFTLAQEFVSRRMGALAAPTSGCALGTMR